MLSLLILPLGGWADDTHTVLNSTESTYEHVMPLHLATEAEYTNRGITNIPDWAKNSNGKFETFPISFDNNGQKISPNKSNVSWIVPDLFSTSKAGAMLQIYGMQIDNNNVPNITGTISLATHNLNNNGCPDHAENPENMLFPGSTRLYYYINSNDVSGTSGSKTLTLKPGYFRIRLTADVLKKLQKYGLTLQGRNIEYDGISIVDPYAVFPGKDKTDMLTIAAPGDWWQNAIILNKNLFTNAAEGYFIHVYTSPDLSKNQSNADVYKGYPTDATKQSSNETSQVYFQVITGLTDSPTKKLVDKGWDYMTSDAYFYLSSSDLENIKNSNTTAQLIVRDATIRKVSIDPVWTDRMLFKINGASQTFTENGSWSDTPSSSTSGNTGYTNDGVTMQIYTRNLQVLNPLVDDTIRIPIRNVKSGAKYQFQLFGDENSSDESLKLKNLTEQINLATTKSVIKYALTAADVEQINRMQTTKTSDPVWYWIALRGQGFTAAGMYFVKNTQSIQIHDVTLDEDNETSTIGEEPNVNVTIHRTFTKGQWNTLMFPFDLTASQINKAFGPNCQVARFERGDIEDDNNEDYQHKYKIIYLTSRTHIYANQPMIIKINDDGYIKSGDKYTFNDVTMTFNNGATKTEYGNGYIQFGQYTVVGTYSKIPKLPKYAIIMLSKANDHHNDSIKQDFYWVGDNTIKNGGKQLKGFRWYMYFGSEGSVTTSDYDAMNGGKIYSGTGTVSAKVYLDGQLLDDDATSAITGLPKANVDDDCVFNLQGQYLGRRSKLNLAPGVYIMNGKKVKI